MIITQSNPRICFEPAPNMRMQSDRFAREIVAFLTLSYAARSQRLMRKPLGGAVRRLMRPGIRAICSFHFFL